MESGLSGDWMLSNEVIVTDSCPRTTIEPHLEMSIQMSYNREKPGAPDTKTKVVFASLYFYIETF